MLNETNITIDVARAVINLQNEESNFLTVFVQLIQQLISIISILAMAYMTHYTIKNNSRNIFIQANEKHINDSILELVGKIKGGQKKIIEDFLKSREGIYIPESLNIKLLKDLKKMDPENIANNQKITDKMSNRVRKYLSP